MFALGDYHRSGEITYPEIFIGYTFHPMSLLAVGLVCYGICRTFADRRTYFLAVALCAGPLSFLAGVHASRQTTEEINDAENVQWWSGLDNVAEAFCDYYRSHPGQVHPMSTGHDEVICDDFVTFYTSRIHTRSETLKHDATRFLDHRGQPLRYYVHLDPNTSTEDIPTPRGCVGVSDNTGYERINHTWPRIVVPHSSEAVARFASSPYSHPVDHMPGYVLSPYPPLNAPSSPYTSIVDVRGLSNGTLVAGDNDKVFRVP